MLALEVLCPSCGAPAGLPCNGILPPVYCVARCVARDKVEEHGQKSKPLCQKCDRIPCTCMNLCRLCGFHQCCCSALKGLMFPMLLWCPECGTRHIDEGEFATKIHHTHSCQSCGMTWRPAVVATVGVRFLPGFRT